jgi:uncharacterized membrane protein YhaH (DUF805 family)
MQTPSVPLNQQARPMGKGPAAVSIAPMSFGDAVAACFRKYAQFSGRARRAEYWYWSLFVFLLSFGAGLVLTLALGEGSANAVYGILVLALLLPGLAVFIRRLHDTDRSGWWCLLYATGIGSLVLLVWVCQEGTKGTNRFGPRTT